MQEKDGAYSNDGPDEEITLLDLLIVILKHKKMIAVMTAVVCLTTVLVSLFITPKYRSRTTIYSSMQQGSSLAGDLASQLGGLSAFTQGSINLKDTNNLLVDILRSRTILDSVVDRFGLEEIYQADHREDARMLLADQLHIRSDGKSGVITIEVEDRDPEQSARMANTFVEELKGFTSGLAVTEASKRRLFFEKQLKETKGALLVAEDAMQNLQERTGALQMESQARTVISGMANLRAQIASQEVQLQVMRSYATLHNPDVQRIKETLKGLKSELKKLESGEGKDYDPIMPTGRLPEVGAQYSRRLRDLKFNEKLYELLLKQYETARLDEAKDATLIQVIDQAEVPIRRYKPQRTQMVIIFTFLGLLVSVILAFGKEYYERISMDPGNQGRLETLKKYFVLKASSDAA
jgi:tyrosine-protein kinase Etk/Wzc